MIETLAARGEDAWFRLGDRDLTHLVRTERLGRGAADRRARALAASLRVPATILPMTDDEVRTEIRTPTAGSTSRSTSSTAGGAWTSSRCASGASRRPASRRGEAGDRGGRRHRHRAVEPDRVDRPILALPGVREALAAAAGRGTPIVAVSGIVGGRALRGRRTGCSRRSATSRPRWASPASTRDRGSLRAGYGGSRAGHGDRDARHADAGHGHGDDRRRARARLAAEVLEFAVAE